MAAIEKSVRATAAIDDLYRRHVGDVYRYTYAVLGNHADAEDVTQTTFVNALRALERGEEPRNPGNWLIVIAHNIVRQRWRQAAARPTEVELVNDVPDVSGEDDVELDGLVRALQRIPPSQREALVMRELEGRSYQEISELLGLTTSALETLLFRARRSLAEELENVVTCQSAELAMSRRLDERLSRKESRRLDEHLAECASCAKLSAAQTRQRRAFKGLALIPLPVGLALFKGAPSASAASLPTIGLAGANGPTGAGAATAGTGAAGAGTATGGVGGSLLGAAAVKVAAAVVAGVLVTGAAYQGAKAIFDEPGSPVAAKRENSAVKGAFANQGEAASQQVVSSSGALPVTASSAASSGSGLSLGHESSAPGAEAAAGASTPETQPGAAPPAKSDGGASAPTMPQTPPADNPGNGPGNGPGDTPGNGPGNAPGGPGASPGDGPGGSNPGGTPQAPSDPPAETPQTPPATPPTADTELEPPTASDPGPSVKPKKAKKPKKVKKPRPTTPVSAGEAAAPPPGQANKADKAQAPGQARKEDAPPVADATSAENAPQPVDGRPKHDKAVPDSGAAAAPATDSAAAPPPDAVATAPASDAGSADRPGIANGHAKK